MYLLGFDIGSSSVKVSLMDAEKGNMLASSSYPKTEMGMIAQQTGWAEQEPKEWWAQLKLALQDVLQQSQAKPENIKAIGISYQMHGLVAVDKDGNVVRPSIIWCDSRAVGIGEKAIKDLGEAYCLGELLNSPGNFTASKLKWVKENEPEVYAKIHKIMLPGDYIAYKLTGQIQTTISGLSEGVMWNFKKEDIAKDLLAYYGIPEAFIPDLVPTFSIHGHVSVEAAKELGLSTQTVISYRAGDQPNNAFSLNVLHQGELAATAGTSGVVYGILDKPAHDAQSRVNTFVHVNHQKEKPRFGVLLCVNGTGIQNSWLKNTLFAGTMEYDQMNDEAGKAPIGSDGLCVFPFGNGAERPLANQNLGGAMVGLQFNRHGQAHILRAAQEGIAFGLNYGMDIMRAMGIDTHTIRAGKANMFLSPIFRDTFSHVTGATVELYNTDGAQGAARGAGIGCGLFGEKEAFAGLKVLETIEPKADKIAQYQDSYQTWLLNLKKIVG